MPARTYRVSFGGEIASAYVFDPAKVDGAVLQLRSQPGVKSAERSAVAAFPAPRRFGTRGGLPLDFRSVVAHDGVLQAQPGDTVIVRYTQPDSSVLELPTIIPPSQLGLQFGFLDEKRGTARFLGIAMRIDGDGPPFNLR